MIIECTACSKRFSVPDSAIKTEGRLVQCSSCGNKWTQYPINLKKPTTTPIIQNVQKASKRKTNIKKTPIPYSKEYMQQKWGSSIKSDVFNKELNKKNTKKTKNNKKSIKKMEKISFGFFNYIITLGVLITFFIGILSFERSRLARKFPFLEPYINNFFETLENFKIFILNFYQ